MIQPPFLQPGDSVAVVSTSNFTEQAYIDQLVEILKSWGLKPVLGKSIGARQGSFAGSDRLRQQDLQEMLDRPDIKAIFETMGGYGIIRIVEDLDFNAFKKQPKWVIGYSDTTFLHSHLQGMLNVASLQATMAADLEVGYQKMSWETLRKALFGEKLAYSVAAHPLNRLGEAKGTLTGGTLSILCNAKGTLTDTDTNGKILFLEETSEHKYRVDSYLQSLKRARKFDYLRGLVVGNLTEIEEDDPPFGMEAEEIILEAVKDYDFPVCFGFPAGHGPVNKALYFGVPLQLKVTESGSQITFKPGNGI
ncbi:LD-carboxypeptidase [Rufibacter sp. LB8]|uniref:S66 peptidase family protein n=1 Tax=Rufibacter sp. LB8 TaxID=2777781 RepID=UPI00178C4089|nr:LD-carboxypeptidase [Rufibacter sp. LB8]